MTVMYDQILAVLLFSVICVCGCICLGSLFEVLEETGGSKANVTERLGKKRLHSGKLELIFRPVDHTSSTILTSFLCF